MLPGAGRPETDVWNRAAPFVILGRHHADRQRHPKRPLTALIAGRER
jgi:hypothetical protein